MKRLTFAGVKIVTPGEGEASGMTVAFKGTMNALFLKDLAAKARRGQRGRAADGRVAGGRAYGYEVAVELDTRARARSALRRRSLRGQPPSRGPPRSASLCVFYAARRCS